MTFDEKKLLVDILGKRIDILHKKLLIILGGIAGTWYYGIDFLKQTDNFLNVIGVVMFIIFIFLISGLIIMFLKLNRFDKNLEKVQNGME